MEVVIRRGDIAARAAGLTGIGVLEGARRLDGAAAAVDRATRGAVSAAMKRGGFRGRFLEVAVLYPTAGRLARVALIGLGRAADLTEHRVRLASAKLARLARETGARTLATVVHGAGAGGLDPHRAAHAVAEGAVLGHWRYSAYKTDGGTPPLQRVELVEHDAALAKALAPDVAAGVAWAEAACLARDLASTPGEDLTPERLAARAREIGKTSGAKVTTFDVAHLERLGMGALLAVGRGSVHPPRFIVLDRPASRAKRGTGAPVVLIGKGVTFDTGGISLKPRENMQKMKYDMSGAAAVLGVFAALPSLDPPFRVVGLIPSAENMPGGRAVKPGDVVRALDGTTIEVTNTDAEGRLLLADALGYARSLDPEVVVDLATLTGAISLALGPYAAGLFTDDDGLADELLACGSATGERLWRMPVWDEYLTQMRGETADLVNSAFVKEGAASLAAAFLKHFARGMRWAHLDIASTAWTSADRPHEPRGPTGFGVRLLLEWLSSRTKRSSTSPA
jgi:leucyl aminopeptidase